MGLVGVHQAGQVDRRRHPNRCGDQNPGEDRKTAQQRRLLLAQAALADLRYGTDPARKAGSEWRQHCGDGHCHEECEQCV
jgi:hypothetical protein